MISQRSAQLLSAGLGLCLALACRDAPTAPAPPAAQPRPSADIAIDTVDEFPPEPRILNPYTQIGYVDQGGRHLAEYRVGMEYIGNKASMSTEYVITGDGVSMRDKIYNEQDSYYDFHLWKHFDRVYYVEVPRSCGLELGGGTQHQAWWFLYVRIMPDWKSIRAAATSYGTPYHLEPCEEEHQPTTTTSGGGNGGGYITITTCWYWATIVKGLIVAIEFDYCESSTIPIDEAMLNNMT